MKKFILILFIVFFAVSCNSGGSSTPEQRTNLLIENFPSCVILNRDDVDRKDVWDRFHIFHENVVKVIKIDSNASSFELEETWDTGITEKWCDKKCPEVEIEACVDSVTIEKPVPSNVSCLDGYGVLTIKNETYYIGKQGSYNDTLKKVKCYDIQ